jgi:hypothetical protein
MYLKLSEVTLVLNAKRRSADDVPAYLFTRAGEPCITSDAAVGTRYGVLYFDASDIPCVIPDDIEAARASVELNQARKWVE